MPYINVKNKKKTNVWISDYFAKNRCLSETKIKWNTCSYSHSKGWSGKCSFNFPISKEPIPVPSQLNCKIW